MKFLSRRNIFFAASFAMVALGAIAVEAQATAPASYGKLHGADVGVAATGQYTTSITNQTIGSAGELLTHETTTDSPGVLFTLRAHP